MDTPTPKQRRLMFLDVDGVINPWQGRGFAHGDRKVVIGGTRVWLIATVAEWLQERVASGVEIVWATTWVTQVRHLNAYAKRLGLPTGLSRIDYRPNLDFDLRNCGKAPSIRDWLAAEAIDPAEHRVVWIDDDIGPDDRTFAADLGIRPFAPNPASGLWDHRMRQRIAQYLESELTDV